MSTAEPDHVADATILNAVRAHLAALVKDATTTAHITARLAAAGVTGIPRQCGHCPISVYLQQVSHGRNVYVGGEHITIPPRGSVWLELPTPPILREFMARFDIGEIPELVTPGAEIPKPPTRITA